MKPAQGGVAVARRLPVAAADVDEVDALEDVAAAGRERPIALERDEELRPRSPGRWTGFACDD